MHFKCTSEIISHRMNQCHVNKIHCCPAMLPAPALPLLLFLSWARSAHTPPCLPVKGTKTSFHIKVFWLVADLLNTFKHWTFINKCPCRVQAAPTAQEVMSGKGFGRVSFLPCSQEAAPGSWLWAAGTAGGICAQAAVSCLAQPVTPWRMFLPNAWPCCCLFLMLPEPYPLHEPSSHSHLQGV